MKRALLIAGYSLCIIAGMYVSVTTKIWPFVWTVGFPLVYAGVLGLYMIIKERDNGNCINL